MNRHAKGFIGVVIGVSCSVQAVTRTWLSSTGGVWTSTANWSDSTIPGAGDTADLSAVTGAVDVTENIAVGAILYNPAFSGTTNTLTLLSDTAAPGSRSISLTTTAPSQIQVGEGAQLLIDADLTPTVDVVKDGRGSLVIKRRLASAYEVSLAVVQGSVVNEGSIEYPVKRTFVGTLGSDTGPAAGFVMREGSTYVASSASDVIFGCLRTFDGSGARAVVMHEGGTLNLTGASSSEPFLNGFWAGAESVYNISGGELNLSNKRLNVAYFGSGTVNQSGGKVSANQIYFTPNESSGSAAGVYNLTGGELWLGGVARGYDASGTSAFNLGGGCVYPFNAGYEIWGIGSFTLSGINGPTRFCSDEQGSYTSALYSLSGPGGLIKEGSDTLILGGTHTFTGPVIVSNGTLRVEGTMSGANDVTVAGGTVSIQNVAVKFGSLHIEGGVFETAVGSAVTLAGGADHWVRVSGGRFRMLGGDLLLSVAVSGTGLVELGQGVAASVLRLSVNGTDLEPGLYTAANCPAITGAGTLEVKISGKPIADTFTRADGPVANDSLGSTEAGGADWHEFKVNNFTVNAASIENGELRLGDGTSDPCLAVASASWPSGVFSARMRFNKVDGSGATVKNGCGLVMRRALGSRLDIEADMAGSVSLLMTPAGALFVRENALDTKYGMNPFTGSPDFWVYGSAGSLPASINGLPFDADGDGRLGDSEPFDFQAILSGSRLQVLVNGQPVMAANGFAPGDPVADNCPGFFKNRLDSGAAETHDVLFDNYSVTNLPYVIRHIGAFDPNVGAALPVENWTVAGDAGAVAVGPVTETVGGETVDAWKVDDASATAFAYYSTALSAAEAAWVNTNRWRMTLRMRVVGSNDAADWGVCAIVAGSGNYTLLFGSDASGNAQVSCNGGAAVTVPGGSVYHTYTLQYSPVHSRANLHCDGEPLALSIPWAEGGGDRLVFGAGDSAQTGCAHYALVQFECLPQPVPGTLLKVR